MVDLKIPLDLVSYGNERVGEEIKRRRRRRRTRRKSGEEEEKRERERIYEMREPPSRHGVIHPQRVIRADGLAYTCTL